MLFIRAAASCANGSSFIPFGLAGSPVDRMVAAYILLQELQLRADRTALAGAQVARLRQALLTIGVHVLRSVRRIVLHFPQSHPEADTWMHLARDLARVRP